MKSKAISKWVAGFSYLEKQFNRSGFDSKGKFYKFIVCKLVVSHEAGDEGFEYVEWLKEYAHEHHVDLRLVTIQMADPWRGNGDSRGKYTLWDVYPYADFITYPSLYEQFFWGRSCLAE